MNFDRMQYFERCDRRGLGVFRRKDVSLPASEIYDFATVVAGQKPFGFSNILKSPYGLNIGINRLLFKWFDRINILDRGAGGGSGVTWGTSQAEVDGIFNPAEQKHDILFQWAPRFIPLSAARSAK